MTRWSDRLIQILCWFAALLVLGVVATLLIFLLQRGGPTLGPSLLDIRPAVVGTLLLVAGATLIAVPLGVASGIWLAEYGRGPWARAFSATASVLAGVPSIIMGLFGFGSILLLRQTIAPHARDCLLLSMICLALLVLPYLIRATENALTAIPEPVRLLGPSLGLSRWQSIWHVHLPAARWGIHSGIVLAIGRVAEDTAVILMTGATLIAGIPRGLTDHYEALPFYIFTQAGEGGAAELDRAFGAALILLCLSTFLLTLAYLLTRWAKRNP